MGEARWWLVRFNVYLAYTCVTCLYDGYFIPAAQLLQVVRGRWLCPVFMLMVLSPPLWFRVHRGSVDFSNVHLLDCAVPLASGNHTLRLARINVTPGFMLVSSHPSDHLPVLFNLTVSCPVVSTCALSACEEVEGFNFFPVFCWELSCIWWMTVT